MFGDDFFGFAFDLGGGESKIFEKQEESLSVEVLFFVLESVESHVFSDFENVGAVILEDFFQMIESVQGEFFALVDKFEP